MRFMRRLPCDPPLVSPHKADRPAQSASGRAT